jgi:hypothetical protein
MILNAEAVLDAVLLMSSLVIPFTIAVYIYALKKAKKDGQ